MFPGKRAYILAGLRERSRRTVAKMMAKKTPDGAMIQLNDAISYISSISKNTAPGDAGAWAPREGARQEKGSGDKVYCLPLPFLGYGFAHFLHWLQSGSAQWQRTEAMDGERGENGMANEKGGGGRLIFTNNK